MAATATVRSGGGPVAAKRIVMRRLAGRAVALLALAVGLGPAQAGLATLKVSGTAEAVDGAPLLSLSPGTGTFALELVYDTTTADSSGDPLRGAFAGAVRTVSLVFNGGVVVPVRAIEASRIRLDDGLPASGGRHQERIDLSLSLDIVGDDGDGSSVFTLTLDHRSTSPLSGTAGALLSPALADLTHIDLASFETQASGTFCLRDPGFTGSGACALFLLQPSAIELAVAPPPDTTPLPVPAPATPALLLLGLVPALRRRRR